MTKICCFFSVFVFVFVFIKVRQFFKLNNSIKTLQLYFFLSFFLSSSSSSFCVCVCVCVNAIVEFLRMVDSFFYSGRKIPERCETSFEVYKINYQKLWFKGVLYPVGFFHASVFFRKKIKIRMHMLVSAHYAGRSLFTLVVLLLAYIYGFWT